MWYEYDDKSPVDSLIVVEMCDFILSLISSNISFRLATSNFLYFFSSVFLIDISAPWDGN